MSIEHPSSPEVPTPKTRSTDFKREIPPNLEEEPLLPFPELQETAMEDFIHKHAEIGFEGSKDRIIEILKIVKEDPEAIKMINDTLQAIFRYIDMVYTSEVRTKILALHYEGEEYKERVSAHDSRRKRAHEALISSLISCTRYLNQHFGGKIPQTGIYNGDPSHLTQQNRIAIAEWAIEVEHEILLGRSL